MEQLSPPRPQRFGQMRTGARESRGFVLMMTLIVLVIMTMSAVAMMKLMGAGVATAGNIAFRQAAVRAADLGMEGGALSYLKGQTATQLENDDSANGYCANNDSSFSPQSFDFLSTSATTTCQIIAKKFTDAGGHDTFSGYRIFYVIHRMAAASGFPCSSPSAHCVMPPVAAAAPDPAHIDPGVYQAPIQGTTGLVYYRVTAKVVGPRFNNRFVQVFYY